MQKKAYCSFNVCESIDSAIELLCSEIGRATPTDVLRLVGLDECNTTRTLVLERAEGMEYAIKTSGRGYVILDEINPIHGK